MAPGDGAVVGSVVDRGDMLAAIDHTTRGGYEAVENVPPSCHGDSDVDVYVS